MWCSTSVACVLLLYSLLRVSEVFIPRQRQHQLTWRVDLKVGEGGARVNSCTHHSAVQRDPRPCRAVSHPASALCFLPLSLSLVFTWTGHCYTKDPVCHQNQGSAGAIGARELRLCPAQDDPRLLPVAPLWRGIEANEERLSHLLCVILHRPCSYSCIWVG